MNVVFLRLYLGEEREYRYVIDTSDRHNFVDLVLLPALRRVMPTHKLNNLALSSSTDAWRTRSANNQLLYKGTFIPSTYLALAVPEMRRIVQDTPALKCYADFRFYTQGIGLKASFANPLDISLEFPDLDWNAFDNANLFLDVGFEVAPLNPTTGCVAVWRSDTQLDSRFPFSGLVSSFWGGPSSLLAPSSARVDLFSGFLSLGGVDYHSVSASRPSLLGVEGLQKLVAYCKVKQPFYNRTAGSDRTSKDFRPSDMWSMSPSYLAHVVSS